MTLPTLQPNTTRAAMEHTALDIALTAIRMHAEMHPRPSQVNQRQAAEMLNVCVHTVSKLIRAGTLSLNACGLIPITDIDRALATRR